MNGKAALLVFRTGATLGALPVEHVVETMRPLALTPVASAPPYVAGAAVVRGEAVPVIDLSLLLTGTTATAARWISVRAGARTAALAVGEVIGVRRTRTAPAPALVGGAAALEELGVLDRELLVVIAAARLVTEEAWRAFDAASPSGGGT